jgi:hypothetical protein
MWQCDKKLRFLIKGNIITVSHVVCNLQNFVTCSVVVDRCKYGNGSSGFLTF